MITDRPIRNALCNLPVENIEEKICEVKERSTWTNDDDEFFRCTADLNPLQVEKITANDTKVCFTVYLNR